jgi:hypothetical protein
MRVVIFDEHVKGRARPLEYLVSRWDTAEHPYTKIMRSFCMAGVGLRDAETHVARGGSQGSGEWRASIGYEENTQSILRAHGIVSDEEAMAFLDRVEPLVKVWQKSYAEFMDRCMSRHKEELRIFLEGLSD